MREVGAAYFKKANEKSIVARKEKSRASKVKISLAPVMNDKVTK